MSRALVAIIAGVSIPLAIAACDSFGAEPSGPGDGGGADATVVLDAATDDVANLVVNGGFELTPCGSWEPNFGRLEAATLSHAGTYSCLVCGTGSTSTFYQATNVVARPGEQYQLAMWTRMAPDAAAPTSQRVMADFGDGDRADNYYGAPTDTWREVRAAGTVADGGKRIVVQIRFPGAQGECLLVDDVSLVRISP